MTCSHHLPPEREQLLNALYGSVTEIPSWESFVHTARAVFACDHAAVVVRVPSTGQSMPVGGYSDADRAAEIDALCEFATVSASMGQVVHHETQTGRALTLCVQDQERRTATIALLRNHTRPDFDDQAETLLHSLSESLQRSLKIYFNYVDLTRKRIVSEAALETSRIGVILADMDGEVILTNKVADQYLTGDNGLRISRGRLRAQTAEQTNALLAEIRQRALEQTAESNWQSYAPMAFTRSENALPMTVIVRPGPAFYPVTRPHLRTAILVLRDPAISASVPALTLARLFGLSAAESLLASELVRGATLEEVASKLGISRNTVRSQLQGIFLKTGLNRQSDLIRVLLNSAATSI